MGLKIIDSAKYSPERIITNDELAQTLDTSDEWISKRTGIKRRHRIGEETNATMATRVAEALLTKTNTVPEEVDLIRGGDHVSGLPNSFGGRTSSRCT